MQIPALRGMIDRRILINYRVEADVLARILPAPFRPQVVRGFGIAGICLIRLTGLRPRWAPAWAGFGSENAAHRIAVEWTADGTTRHGVYIPRRDSSSWWNAFVGGRLFPGVHHHSRFVVSETGERYQIELTNWDGTFVSIDAKVSNALPADSVFDSLEEAAEFFTQGSVGYSPSRCAGTCDGLELCAAPRDLAPLHVQSAESSYLSDPGIFPAGSAQFDCALLMRHVPHEWRPTRRLLIERPT